MKNLLFTVFFLAGTLCFADQNANQDVKIINGKDYFDTSSKMQLTSSEIKSIDGKQYQVYHVVKGDGWYGIARKYEIPYTELRSANKQIGDQLSLGCKILIPVNNFQTSNPVIENSQKISSPAIDEMKFHIVLQSQTLFSISMMYGKSVEQIKKWNNLVSNTISVGQKLIVSKDVATENNNSKHEIKDNLRKENVALVTTHSSKTSEVNPQDLTKSIAENSSYEKEENSSGKNLKDNNDIIKIEQKQSEINKTDDEKIVFANGRYEVKENGLASYMVEENSNIEKYYALHRTAPIGTVIRVLNTSNSKKIFVKITGTLPDTQENKGFVIKISKASADKLDVTEKSFEADLLYGINKN